MRNLHSEMNEGGRGRGRRLQLLLQVIIALAFPAVGHAALEETLAASSSQVASQTIAGHRVARARAPRHSKRVRGEGRQSLRRGVARTVCARLGSMPGRIWPSTAPHSACTTEVTGIFLFSTPSFKLSSFLVVVSSRESFGTKRMPEGVTIDALR